MLKLHCYGTEGKCPFSGPCRNIEGLFRLRRDRRTLPVPQEPVWGIHLPTMPARRCRVHIARAIAALQKLGDFRLCPWIGSSWPGHMGDLPQLQVLLMPAIGKPPEQ